MKTFSIGGVHPKDYKLNADAASCELPLPKQVCVMVQQHLGAPSKILVSKGDKVKVGQALTENSAFIGSIVHAPVSGTVSKIGEHIDATAYPRPAIFIDVEGDDWMDDIDRSDDLKQEISLSRQEIIEKIKEKGVVGLGGACFPTHVKLSIPEGNKVEYLLINAVECEPFLTDDYCLMMEKPQEILVGIKILMKALGVHKAIVGIENNKPKAIELLKQYTSSEKEIEICPLKMKYPQGAEKQLIKALTGRVVPSGKLPLNVGCVVNNVSTCFAVYEAVQKNKPLIEKLVTLTGLRVQKVQNYKVRIGVSISEIIEASGDFPQLTTKIILGGPMMGKAVVNTKVPVVKGTSAVLLVDKDMAHREKVYTCIRCGKCVEACPMGLEPYLLSAASEKLMWDKVEAAKVMDCIECGCCQYTCPSQRYLLDAVRLGKYQVGQIIKKRNAK